jgi:hypothetical protein
MMNCTGFGKKLLWPNFKVLYLYSPGGIEENNDEAQSGSPVSGPRFEPGTSRI